MIVVDPFQWQTFVIIVAIVIGVRIFKYTKITVSWFVTMVHELGHAIPALLTGRRIKAIHLQSDGSGDTLTLAREGPFHRIISTIVLFGGYSAPIYLGGVLIIVTAHGGSNAMFHVLVGVGIISFIFTRNLFGFVIIGLYLATISLINIIHQGSYVPLLVVAFGLIYLMGGLIDLVVIAMVVFSGIDNGSDFHILAENSILRIGPRLWFIIFILTHTGITITIINHFF